jgi:hypothetical protein
MQVIDESLIAEAGRRLVDAAPGARVILFEDWANVRGSLVHAALSQGRVLAG